MKGRVVGNGGEGLGQLNVLYTMEAVREIAEIKKVYRVFENSQKIGFLSKMWVTITKFYTQK